MLCALVCVCVLCAILSFYMWTSPDTSLHFFHRKTFYLFAWCLVSQSVRKLKATYHHLPCMHALCDAAGFFVRFFWLPKTIIVNLWALTRSHTTSVWWTLVDAILIWLHTKHTTARPTYSPNIELKFLNIRRFPFCLSPSDPLNCILISFCLFTYLPLLSAFEAPTMHITCILCFISHIQFHI